jgi:hypothetical protein
MSCLTAWCPARSASRTSFGDPPRRLGWVRYLGRGALSPPSSVPPQAMASPTTTPFPEHLAQSTTGPCQGDLGFSSSTGYPGLANTLPRRTPNFATLRGAHLAGFRLQGRLCGPGGSIPATTSCCSSSTRCRALIVPFCSLTWFSSRGFLVPFGGHLSGRVYQGCFMPGFLPSVALEMARDA